MAINSNVDADQRKETNETNGQSMRDSRRETRTPNKILATKQSSQEERKKDKQNYINNLATQAEMTAHRRDMKESYDITRTLAGKEEIFQNQ